MRGFIAGIIMVCLLFTAVPVVGATPKPIDVYYQGQLLTFPSQPIVVNNFMLVPMRKIFETIGAKVVWNGPAKSITALKNNSFMKLTIGKQFAYLGGNGFWMDVAPIMTNGTTLVPLRFVSESLGLEVKWNEQDRTINLTPLKRDVIDIGPSVDYERPSSEDVSGVSLFNLSENVQTHVIAIPNNRLAFIKEKEPTTPYPNIQTVELNSDPGSQSRALIDFDLSALKGKIIKSAYLRMVNNKSLETNAIRTISIKEMYKPWTVKATWWNTGSNPWDAPGAGGKGDSGDVTVYQTNYRVIGWEPSWFINVTSIVNGWNTGYPNNGLMLVSDKIEYVYNPYTSGLKPFLVVEYADSPNAPDLSYKSKLKLALDFLGTNYNRGPWSDSTIGIINSQINADKLGLGDTFLASLTTYFNDFIDDNGNLKGSAVLNSYYKGALGKALIYMHQRTGQEKYRIALEKIRRMFDTLPQVEGIYIDQNTYQSEIVYLGLDFLAAYGQAYNDPSARAIAMDQTIKIYDQLHSADTDGIPYTLLIKTDKVEGLPKGIGWGRGIGWLYAGMGKLLTYDTIKQDPKYAELTKRFKEISATLAKYQGTNGMWRNLIQFNESPYETTGTAMIALGMEYGVHEGVLDGSYEGNINKSVNGLQGFTRTGVDVGNAFPSNQDLMYTYPYLTTSRNSFGFWMELLTTRELYRKEPT